MSATFSRSNIKFHLMKLASKGKIFYVHCTPARNWLSTSMFSLIRRTDDMQLNCPINPGRWGFVNAFLQLQKIHQIKSHLQQYNNNLPRISGGESMRKLSNSSVIAHTSVSGDVGMLVCFEKFRDENITINHLRKQNKQLNQSAWRSFHSAGRQI